MKSTSKKRTPSIVNLTVQRRYLTQREIERLMDCARKHGRYGHRDATMILVAYRHGLRASEVCGSWGTAGKTRNTKKVVPCCASQQKLCAKSAKPYRGNDFSEQFRKWSDDAGLPHCSAHGLRKAGCRRMAEAGYTAHEIAAWSGHTTLDEVSRYTKAVDQERLARNAMEREQTGTQRVKPDRARVSKPLM